MKKIDWGTVLAVFLFCVALALIPVSCQHVKEAERKYEVECPEASVVGVVYEKYSVPRTRGTFGGNSWEDLYISAVAGDVVIAEKVSGEQFVSYRIGDLVECFVRFDADGNVCEKAYCDW